MHTLVLILFKKVEAHISLDYCLRESMHILVLILFKKVGAHISLNTV